MATARVVTLPSGRSRPGRDRQDRHLRVVRRDRRGGLALRLSPRTGVVLTVLLFIALFGVAVSHALLIEGQARLDALDQDVAAEQARYEELRRQVAELESPQRILEEATGELGMVPAAEPMWLSPEQPAPRDDTPESEGEPPPSPDTSAARVKPYLEPAP